MNTTLLKNKEWYFDGIGMRQRARKMFGVKLETLKAIALIILFFFVLGVCGAGTFPY